MCDSGSDVLVGTFFLVINVIFVSSPLTERLKIQFGVRIKSRHICYVYQCHKNLCVCVSVCVRPGGK